MSKPRCTHQLGHKQLPFWAGYLGPRARLTNRQKSLWDRLWELEKKKKWKWKWKLYRQLAEVGPFNLWIGYNSKWCTAHWVAGRVGDGCQLINDLWASELHQPSFSLIFYLLLPTIIRCCIVHLCWNRSPTGACYRYLCWFMEMRTLMDCQQLDTTINMLEISLNADINITISDAT